MKNKKVNRAEQELYYWVHRKDATNFHAQLFTLIGKADPENRARLALGFPDEVEAITRYQREKGYWDDLVKRMINF